MQQFLIKGINGILLVLILIGIPAVSRAQFGSWEISSVPTTQALMYGGLVLAIVLNVLGATLLMPGLKAKERCAEWAFIFGGLLFLEYAYFHRWFNFDWFKKTLQWLQKHF